MVELSVVIPVYKIPKDLLKKSIESVLSQKGYNDDVIEIILVDDGSPDDCGKICDCYAKEYRSVRVVHKENGGLSSARNYGKRFARGEFITFLDADDWVESDFYKQIIDHMQDTDAEIGIGGMCVDDGNNIKIIGKKSKKKVMDSKKALIDMYAKNGFIWSVCDKVYRRSFVYNLNFDESLLFGEDSLFSYQSIKKAKKISYVPTYGYHYYMRETSMTHVLSKNRFILFDIYKYIYDDVKRNIPEISVIALDAFIVNMLNLLSTIRVDDDDCYEQEKRLKDNVKKYFYRFFCVSRVFSLKDRIAFFLAVMPKQVYDFSWQLISYIKSLR